MLVEQQKKVPWYLDEIKDKVKLVAGISLYPNPIQEKGKQYQNKKIPASEGSVSAQLLTYSGNAREL